MTQKRVLAVLVLLTCAAASPLHAQQRPRLSFDVSLGGGYGGGGGERHERNGFVADALIAWRARSVTHGGLLFAANGNWQGHIAVGDSCLLGQNGLCVPRYPNVHTVGLLGGWELARGRGPSVRVLGGPGYYAVEDGGTLGLQARLDLATPALLHIALVGSVRGAVIPRFRNETFGLGALTFGLRFQ